MSETQNGKREEGTLLAEFTKNAREAVRITRSEFKGFDLVDVRVWYSDDGGESYHPGRHGFCVRVEQVADLREALETAAKALAD